VYESILHKRFDVMKLAIIGGTTLTLAIEAAVEINNMKLMEYLYEIGADMIEDSFINAIHARNYDLLEWLYKHDCPWTAMITNTAAGYGYSGILEWLVERGCPWDPVECFKTALAGKKFGVVGWIQQHFSRVH
jgi:hypothetical protein